MAGTAGRSGRRPKPTARKALAGNPGKRALNKDEPVFTPIKGVEPPEWFAEEDLPLATIMWQLTTKELCGQGLLCVTDLAVHTLSGGRSGSVKQRLRCHRPESLHD